MKKRYFNPDAMDAMIMAHLEVNNFSRLSPTEIERKFSEGMYQIAGLKTDSLGEHEHLPTLSSTAVRSSLARLTERGLLEKITGAGINRYDATPEGIKQIPDLVAAYRAAHPMSQETVPAHSMQTTGAARAGFRR